MPPIDPTSTETPNAQTGRHHHRPDGLIDRALRKLFMQPANITEVRQLSERFRALTLQADAFKTADHVPGDKLQIAFGGMASRTYTPFDLDPINGTLCLLGYVHGDSPASRWLDDVRAGDTCDVFGPRRSIDLRMLERPALLIGDETSFALARALQSLGGKSTSVCNVFEVNSTSESKAVLAALGIQDVYMIERRQDDVHHSQLKELLTELMLLNTPQQFVLTGKGSTIQTLTPFLKERDVGTTRKITKAYWVPGKSGLD